MAMNLDSLNSNGNWDKSILARRLGAYAATVVVGEGMQAVLSLVDAGGLRFDFVMDLAEAKEVGESLAGAGSVMEEDPAAAEIIRRRLEEEAIIPYGPTN